MACRPPSRNTTRPRSSTKSGSYVGAWRNLPNPNQWQVTPETARLLQHWRHHQFDSYQPVLLPDRGGRDGDLAGRGRAGSRRRRRQVLDAHSRRQRGGQPRAAAHRAEAGDRRRQDDRHGDADRLADGQRRAASRQQAVLPRLPGRSRPASRSGTGCACCCRTTRTATTASANSCRPTCSATSSGPRSSSPTTTPSAGASGSKSRRPVGRCCRAAAPN